jgi:hypothetical protein
MTTDFEWSPKSPTESINYGIDFSTILKTTDVITTANVTVSLKNKIGLLGDLVKSGVAVINGLTVIQRFSAGTDTAEYLITFSITTAAGEVFEECKCLNIAVKTC